MSILTDLRIMFATAGILFDKESTTGVEGLTADNTLLKQAADLALLANGMLKGKALSDFIKRSEGLLG